MATIKRIEIQHDDKRREHAPMVRVGLNGEGCGVETCHCSDGHFLSVSDGHTWFTVKLTPDEAERIKSGFAGDVPATRTFDN